MGGPDDDYLYEIMEGLVETFGKRSRNRCEEIEKSEIEVLVFESFGSLYLERFFFDIPRLKTLKR